MFPLIGDHGTSSISNAETLPSVSCADHVLRDLIGCRVVEVRCAGALRIGHGGQINLIKIRVKNNNNYNNTG